MLIWILVLLVVGFLIYVRLAPHDAGRWHRAPKPGDPGATRLTGGYIWREEVDGDVHARIGALDRIVRETPATHVLAGSVDEGQITYVTRTKWAGFPDYTTVRASDGNVLEVYGRLRFGRSDFGVNAKRIKGWLAQL